jgi:hypothetical protein
VCEGGGAQPHADLSFYIGYNETDFGRCFWHGPWNGLFVWNRTTSTIVENSSSLLPLVKENDGVLCGTSMLDALRRLPEMNSSAAFAAYVRERGVYVERLCNATIGEPWTSAVLSACKSAFEKRVARGVSSDKTIRKDGCSARHTNRPWCMSPQPCEPAKSCISRDFCSRQYRSEAPTYRCSACTEGYYRIAGECRKCPDNPWIMIVGFIVIVLAAGVIGYVLNRKAVNVAFLSIGVDYFQVLAMFSRSNVKWPTGLQNLFLALSAFNFNIDVTAPESAMPNVGFKSKWCFMQALPVSAMSLFGLLHIVQYLRKRCLLGRSKKLNSHVPALVGTSLVMMYYLYLNLTRGVLDIFNCQPTTPPDGHLYLRE